MSAFERLRQRMVDQRAAERKERDERPSLLQAITNGEPPVGGHHRFHNHYSRVLMLFIRVEKTRRKFFLTIWEFPDDPKIPEDIRGRRFDHIALRHRFDLEYAGPAQEGDELAALLA